MKRQIITPNQKKLLYLTFDNKRSFNKDRYGEKHKKYIFEWLGNISKKLLFYKTWLGKANIFAKN